MFDPVEGNIYANIAPEMVSTARVNPGLRLHSQPSFGRRIGCRKVGTTNASTLRR